MMETNLLFYKIKKGKVTARDYISWSHSLLYNEISSPSLNILSACSPFDNIFEIESYFKRSLKELSIREPTFEACARANIHFLAMELMETGDHKQIIHLADRIFKVVAVEMDYPEDLLSWIEITEQIDRLNYDFECFTLNERDIISNIKNEAKLLLSSDY